MEMTYVVIITVITLVVGAFTKMFVNNVPDKYIPMQNLIIGIISTLICYFAKIEPDFIQAFVLCILASMGAGGIYDLTKTKGDE